MANSPKSCLPSVNRMNANSGIRLRSQTFRDLVSSPYWDSPDLRHVQVCAMRAGKSITVSLADRRRLENLIDDRNVAQKYVWRAEIVLFTADGAGT